MERFFSELKWRHVYRVAAAYAVLAWLLLQVVNNVAPVLDLPVWVVRAFLLALVIGFPVAMLFAWMRELPSDRAAPTTATTRLDNVIAGALVVVIALASGRADAQQLTPVQVEARIVGTYELVEWRVEGQVLKPPVANGRLVFHNGQIIAMFRREQNGSAYDFAGHGTYLVDEKMWSYGYDYRLEVTGTAGGNTVAHATREQVPFTYRLEGGGEALRVRS